MLKWRRGRTGGLLALGLMAVVTAGCGSTRDAAPVDLTKPAMLEVENNNWNTATVYLAADGVRVRMGWVSSMSTQRFRIPPSYLDREGIRLEVDLLASTERKVTNSFQVWPGDEVELTVQNQLSMTSYGVYPE